MKKTMIAMAAALAILAPTMCSAQAVDGAIDAVGVDHFDHGDFAADCAGVLMYQIQF